MSTFDINATYNEYGDKDLIIGAMFLDTVQWLGIFNDIDQDMLFTEQQYRLMGEKIRSSSNYPEFFRVYKNHFIDTDHTDEFFSLDQRLDFRYQFKEMVADVDYEGKQSVIRVLREWRENGGSHTTRLDWQIEMLETLEHAILQGFDLTSFIYDFINAFDDTGNDINGIEFVVVSNNLLMTYNHGFWRIVDTLGWDRNNSTIQSDYDDTIPFNFANNFDIFNTNHYPLIVRSKAPYDEIYFQPDDDPDGRAFPSLTVDNVYNKLYFYSGQKNEALNEGGEFILDPEEYGIGTYVGDAHVLNIAAVQIPNNDNQTYYFFHRMIADDADNQDMNNVGNSDRWPITQAVYYQSSVDPYPMILEPSFQFRDSITSFNGKVFSIDTIELLPNDTIYDNYKTTYKQYLLITGIFTLVDAGTNTHTNIAIYDADNNVFVPVNSSSIDTNYWENVLVNDVDIEDNSISVYKLDSISATKRNVGLDEDGDPVTMGMESKTFFSIGLKYKNTTQWEDLLDIPPFFILSCKMTLDENDDVVVEASLSDRSYFTPNDTADYKGYLIEGSSYLVQKFGFGMDNIPTDDKLNEGSAREVLLYTGKGIFYCDAINETIGPVSKYNGNKVSPFSVTNLNGEDSNYYVWCNPMGETDKYYNPDNTNDGSSRLMFDESYTKYVSVDDSRFYNLTDMTRQPLAKLGSSDDDGYFLNRYRLWVASGWSTIGGISNYPAVYNNLSYPVNYYNSHIALENSKDDSALIDNFYNSNGSPLVNPTFPDQTKLILVTAENQLFSKTANNVYTSARNKIYYSYKEVDLPIGYGQIVRQAYMRPV